MLLTSFLPILYNNYIGNWDNFHVWLGRNANVPAGARNSGGQVASKRSTGRTAGTATTEQGHVKLTIIPP